MTGEDGLGLPQMREAQLAGAGSLPGVGWATAADWGAGCDMCVHALCLILAVAKVPTLSCDRILQHQFSILRSHSNSLLLC